MSRTTQKLYIGDLLNCRIVTPEGSTIGHVADIQITPAPHYKIKALIFGWGGWFYRLHTLNPFKRGQLCSPELKAILWEDVAAFQRPVVQLKPGYTVTMLKPDQA